MDCNSDGELSKGEMEGQGLCYEDLVVKSVQNQRSVNDGP